MGFLDLLDVVISLAVVYLAASLFVTIANEYVAQMLRTRATQLEQSLHKLLSDPALHNAVMNHPTVRAMDKKRGELVSYLDTSNAAKLIIGHLSKGKSTDLAELRQTIEALGHSDLRTALTGIAACAEGSVKEFSDELADWLDRSLTAMGDSYKRRLQTHSFAIGLAVAVGMNIDTVQIAHDIYHSKPLRSTLVSIAESNVQQGDRDNLTHCLKLSDEQREQDAKCEKTQALVDLIARPEGGASVLPVGWSSWDEFFGKALFGESFFGTLKHWAGWLMTALALSLGAPFWFDLLNRMVNVRHAMRKPAVAKPKSGK